MNPNLAKLQPYPFERLRRLFKDITPDPRHGAINLGIGAVLEPLQGNPTMIKDSCFIGPRCEILAENARVSMGVFIGQRARICNRELDEVLCGRVAAGSVLGSGNLASADGKYSLCCAVIAKRADAGTRARTSINEPLR